MSAVDTSPVYTFQVLAGEHVGRKQVYKKGDCFRSRYELDKLFAGKFQRMPNSPLPLEEETVSVSNASPRPSGTVKEMMPFTFTEATNVTYMFPTAEKADLVVYKDAMGGYAVAEKGVQVMENLAGQVLGSKKAVNAFLKDFAPSDVGED